MVLVQGGGTLLAECKNTLWMILEAEEGASKSPSPLPTPDKEYEAGGFSDSQGSGNVSPTIADMDLIRTKRDYIKSASVNQVKSAGHQGIDAMEGELCSACLPTADAVRFKPLSQLEAEENEKLGDSDDEDEARDCRKGLLDDVDLLQGAEVFPPPMAPLSRCVKGTNESRDCKCKIVFKKCKGKLAFKFFIQKIYCYSLSEKFAAI